MVDALATPCFAIHGTGQKLLTRLPVAVYALSSCDNALGNLPALHGACPLIPVFLHMEGDKSKLLPAQQASAKEQEKAQKQRKKRCPCRWASKAAATQLVNDPPSPPNPQPSPKKDTKPAKTHGLISTRLFVVVVVVVVVVVL